MPSTCAWFTSTRCSMSARTRARSDFSAASERGESAAPYTWALARSTKANPHAPSKLRPITIASWLHRERFEQLIDLAAAVGEGVEADSHLFEQREVEVGERRRLLLADVAPAPHLAGRAAGDEDRQVRMVVEVGVAHAAAVEVERMVQERAISLGRCLQLREELGKQRHVELVDLGHPRDLLGVVPVVRERVVRVGDSDLGIGPS